MPAKYQLGIDIRVYPDGVQYMDINNFYFYPKSNICGSFAVGWFSVTEKEAMEVIEKLQLLKVEVVSKENKHTHYKSKPRIKADLMNKANAEAFKKRQEQKTA
jgi:hypothetical protein